MLVEWAVVLQVWFAGIASFHVFHADPPLNCPFQSTCRLKYAAVESRLMFQLG